MIHYECPKCQTLLESPDRLAGGQDQCPACGQICIVPSQVKEEIREVTAGDPEWEWRTIVSANPERCRKCGRRKGETDPICRACGAGLNWLESLVLGTFFLLLTVGSFGAVIYADEATHRLIGGAIGLFWAFILLGLVHVSIDRFTATKRLPAGFIPLGKVGAVELWDDIVGHDSEKQRSEAVGELERRVDSLQTPVALAMIGAFGSDSWERVDAIERLEDQKLLARIAVRELDESAGMSVVWRLSDEKALSEVAVAGRHLGVCRAALTKVQDEASIYEVAQKAWYDEVRQDAVKNLHDGDMLASIVLEDDDPQLRSLAVPKLRDQAALEMIARTHPQAQVCRASIDRITEQ